MFPLRFGGGGGSGECVRLHLPSRLHFDRGRGDRVLGDIFHCERVSMVEGITVTSVRGSERWRGVVVGVCR